MHLSQLAEVRRLEKSGGGGVSCYGSLLWQHPEKTVCNAVTTLHRRAFDPNVSQIRAINHSENAMSKSVVMAAPATVDLNPSSIPADWILSGTPKAWNKEVSRSHDSISQIVIWECTAGHFKWYYSKDESVIVISGEAFLIKPDGHEIRFGAGDVGFFPAGTTCTWRVPGLFRKVAVIQDPMWRPLAYAVRAWNRFLQMAGFIRKRSLVLVDQRAVLDQAVS